MKMIPSSHDFLSGSALRRSRMATCQFAVRRGVAAKSPCLLDNKGSIKRYCCEICAGWSAFNFTIGDGPVEQPLAWILHKVVCCDEENVIERVRSSTCGCGTPGRKVCVTRMNLFNAVYYWTLSLGSLSAQGLVQPRSSLG